MNGRQATGAGRGARIGDVAVEAGVSTATVSRALASPDQVSPELRARVQAAVAKLGYTPNAAARQLRIKRSRTALVVTRRRWSAPFFAEVLRGLDEEFSAAGYAMVLGNVDEDGGERSRQLVDMMFSGTIDGAVLLSGRVAAADGRTMFEAGLPLVSLCAAIEGTHTILTDEGECIARGARELLRLGHRNFLYLPGPSDNYNEQVRWAALAEVFASASTDATVSRAEQCDFSLAAGVAAARDFLSMKQRPTAVIAVSDENAIGFLQTVQEAGVGVPHDVSVLGFDGIEFADFCRPTLSTIRQPRLELGRAGARILLKAIESGPPLSLSREILPNELQFRGSTGPVCET
ncbi:LacI family DNA-binding transcriptional regulator [Aureimonas phyllosphaerae]|uniref:LacI family DNA-binding transcriptional regulator n=1 Tax=Aureimonas phyllosphaerae TaxID=1166078 RepID=UPI000B82AF44|nr:LacI family DNA-binding transcriptional regulator [Aureimonas phyllosphaerae]